MIIIDARDQPQFDGTVRRSKHAGRIPGAISLPRKKLLDPGTGVHLPVDQQKAVLEVQPPPPPPPLISVNFLSMIVSHVSCVSCLMSHVTCVQSASHLDPRRSRTCGVQSLYPASRPACLFPSLASLPDTLSCIALYYIVILSLLDCILSALTFPSLPAS